MEVIAQVSGAPQVALTVSSATTGEPLLGPVELPGDTSIADIVQQVVASLGLDLEAQRFTETRLVHGATPLGLDLRLTDLADEQTLVQLGAIVTTGKRAELSLLEIQGLSRPHPEATSVVVTAGKDVVDLQHLVEKLPQVEELKFKFHDSFFYAQPASYWAPLTNLAGTLNRLHFSNHHGGRDSGEMDADRIFEALMAWGEDAPKLLSFQLEGAMRVSLPTYASFVSNNRCLLPELEEFVVQYWFANPPLVSTEILQLITKRYQKLRLLEVGSCCWTVSDAAFKYFADNDEGIQAGLELEDLYLVCITQVEGNGWLDVENVQKNLPKLRKFRVGAGRCFCSCGNRLCGSAVPRIKHLQAERGVTFEQGAAHW